MGFHFNETEMDSDAQTGKQWFLLGEKRKLEGNQKKSGSVIIVKITSQLISISKFVLMHLR